MGSINNTIDLPKILDFFGIKNFVETGTGIGASLQHLIQIRPENFKLYSIEILDSLYQNAVQAFAKFPDVYLFQGKSDEKIKDVLAQLSAEPTLFWNDAHFPGADFNINGATYGSESDNTVRIPLEQELRAIASSGRDISGDVFVLDDLRIYEDGPFAGGNWDQRSLFGGNGIDFVFELFSKTHWIQRSYRDQGYVILLPMKSFNRFII